MKLFVVNTLDFEAGWKTEVAFWNGPTTKDMNLWLHWDRWTLGNTIEVDAVVVGKERVMTVRKATGSLLAVEADVELARSGLVNVDDSLCSQQILLLWPQHLWLLLEHQQFPFVQSFGNKREVCICKVVQVDAVDFCAEVYLAAFRVVDGDNASCRFIGVREIENRLLCFEMQIFRFLSYDCCDDHCVELLYRKCVLGYPDCDQEDP